VAVNELLKFNIFIVLKRFPSNFCFYYIDKNVISINVGENAQIGKEEECEKEKSKRERDEIDYEKGGYLSRESLHYN